MRTRLFKSTIAGISVAAIAVALTVPSAFASGAGGGGGGSGNTIQEEVMYGKGKKLFEEKVVCESCPYTGLVLETEAVEQVWPSLKKDIKRDGQIGKDLKRFQRKSLKHFIKERFKL